MYGKIKTANISKKFFNTLDATSMIYSHDFYMFFIVYQNAFNKFIIIFVNDSSKRKRFQKG